MFFAWQAQYIRHLYQTCLEVRALIPEREGLLEHQTCRLAKMILRDRCSTLYALPSLFHSWRNTLARWDGKISKRIGTRPSALHSNFDFGGESRRITLFLTLEKGLQDCFVCDVLKVKSEDVLQNCSVSDLANFVFWSHDILVSFQRAS